MQRKLIPFEPRNKGRLPEDVAEAIAHVILTTVPPAKQNAYVNYVTAEYYTHLRRETEKIKKIVAASVRGEIDL